MAYQMEIQPVLASAEFTRPSDTTAYAVSDSINSTVAAVLTLSNTARIQGGAGQFNKIRIRTDLSTCTATIRVYFFRLPPTAIADNSPQTILYANRAKCMGYVDMPALATEGTGSDCAHSVWGPTDGSFHFKADGTTRDVYAILVSRSAFTPASGQKFYLEVEGDAY